MNEEQENEILAISSIYPDNFSEVEVIIGDEDEENNNFDDGQDSNNEYSKTYQVIITPNTSCLDENNSSDSNDDNNNNGLIIDTSYDYFIYFKFKYTKEYPSTEPPLISIKATWLQKSDQSILLSHLEDLWNQNELVIFQMISWLQEESVQILNNHYKSTKKFSHYHSKKSSNNQPQQQQQQQQQSNQNNNNNYSNTKEKVPTIYTGQSVSEKKSKFQAHLAIVHSEREVQLVLNQLLSFKKIYDATHNMYAYRFQLENGEINEYYNDDGEDGAGDKMLFTLSKNQAKEILVVCTRWFGGILLGGRRYVHIVNTTKDILNLYNTNSLSQCSLEYN
ncbi:hypothetical protein RB653_008224 [Dictyostelium firmibasis]|uniref:RWD domain-containing protein n=1 Tax=Dictyostelium firmibasis TaxID=79012 RepID=A0AAN7TQP7_9MYCE